MTRESELSREEIEEVEPLAADVRAVPGKSRRSARRFALLKIAAALLGRRFDELRQRDQERRIRTQLQISLLLVFLLIGAALLTAFAFDQRQEAVHQGTIAEARMLISQGEAEFDADPLIGLRIAAEGLARVPEGEAELTASLTKRVAAMAAQGRVTKVSSDVREVYHRLPGFPYVLLQN